MRAQLTAEALMLTAITLSLLIIAAYSISKMQGWEQSLFERKVVDGQLNALVAYADEICILGPGNSRTMTLSPMPMELEANAQTLTAKRGGFSLSRDSVCHLDADSRAPYSAKAYLWYERDAGGQAKVMISPAPPP